MTDSLPPIVVELSDEQLGFVLRADGSAELSDGAGSRWQFGPVAVQEDSGIDAGHVWPRTERSACEQFPGRFQVVAVGGNTVRYQVLDALRQPIGGFDSTLEFVDGWLQVSIDEIDAELPSLCFPPPIESESLVVPLGVGRWIREPMPQRYFWRFFSALSMRWFGGLRGDDGWLAVIHEGHPDAGVMATGLSASPGWLTSLGTWTGRRSVRYRLTSGGYVGLARAYRSYAVQEGLHRSLHAKIDAVPAVESLIGGRQLSFMQARTSRADRQADRLEPAPSTKDGLTVTHTFAEVAQLIADAKRGGMRRGMAVLRGWIPGGYDESHPDVWPPEAALGDLEELRALTAGRVAPVVGLHDNYQDIYPQSPSFPRGVVRDRRGQPMRGGQWDGGQAYIVNARDGEAYARRNWAGLEQLGVEAMFVDTTSAVTFYESYEPGNTLTRGQDEEHKRRLLKFYKDKALVVGSEEAADFAVESVDWFENRHRRRHGRVDRTVPLWPLVFHDAALCLRYSDPLSVDEGCPSWLTDVLWGYALLWSRFDGNMLPEGFGSLWAVDDWHADIGTADLVDHRFLTDEATVEQTTFSTGQVVTVNFSPDPVKVEDRVIAGHSWVVSRP